ncbi:hypothetical protein [Actinoplanes regularis]|uniref:hypothetical protein n=1 Tax=Actinoplanes regularis TaxID=52697 RepID=UPI00249FD3B3|nr:hypothetical protein [Actinoplanes regularis]GLW29962.1 hypothetical protein Areg01_29020 [Actinoplanes regularis]
MSETGPEMVIEFGQPEPPESPRGFLRELGTDRRLAPLVAGLGGVAAFASLVSEWQVTTVDGLVYGADEVGATKMLPADLFDLGSLASAYVGGLLLLVIAVLLTLLGPVAGRRYAYLAGLGSGGVLLALLLAMVRLLGDQSRLISRFYTIELDSEHLKVVYGRGLWCALAGVGAGMIALWLSGREARMSDGEPRPRRMDRVEPEFEEPLELSIEPAEPFVTRAADLDRPHHSG